MPRVIVNTAKITRYYMCQDCKLVFQNPRLSDKELGIYYTSGYYRKTINRPPEGMDKAEEDRAKTNFKIIKSRIGHVKSHLDIGCGLGYFLKTVDADLQVGVESDVDYVKFKSIKVFNELGEVLPKKFDLVSSIHSLEHASKPLEYLKEMAKFVKKGCYFIIEVPSLKTRGGPLGFAHLSYFEPDVLKLMCLEVGLKPIHLEFTPHLLLVCQNT